VPGNIIKQKHIDITKETFTKLRADLGRTITVTSTGNADLLNCPNCLLDTVNDESSGVYSPDTPYPSGVAGPTSFVGVCPICNTRGYVFISGTSQITTISSVTITDFKTARKNINYFKGLPGNLENVDVELSMDLTTALLISGGTDITGDNTVFHEADFVTVDSEDYEVEYVSKSGLGELFSLRVFISKIRNK
jgi:hypothetical protein